MGTDTVGYCVDNTVYGNKFGGFCSSTRVGGYTKEQCLQFCDGVDCVAYQTVGSVCTIFSKTKDAPRSCRIHGWEPKEGNVEAGKIVEYTGNLVAGVNCYSFEVNKCVDV